MGSEQVTAKELLFKKDVKTLVKGWFDFDLTPTQETIVRAIAFQEYPRINISCMTRYGKSKIVTLGCSINLMINPGKKIVFLGPGIKQAQLLRTYMAEAIMSCKDLRDITEISSKGIYALKKEASKQKQTFTNGSEFAIFSVEGDAERIMGFGADIVIKEEAALIKREADAKITRMLGDNPEGSMLINLFNPWDVDTQVYDDWLDPTFHNFHVPWQVALKEGRTTQAFIDWQKDRLPPAAFTVLYDSRFPEQGVDSIFSLPWIEKCMRNRFTLWEDYLKLRRQYKAFEGVNKVNAAQLLKRMQEYRVIIACDPADKGLDFTVDYWGIKRGNLYQIIGNYNEATSDNMAIASKVFETHDEIQATHMHVDEHGLGVGVLSRLNQIKRERQEKIVVKGCAFGGTALDPANYRNLKAENYFRLRNILKEGRIDLPDDAVGETRVVAKKLTSELMKMKWERKGKEAISIVDPSEKSPDYADALVYFIWEDKKELTYTFMGVE